MLIAAKILKQIENSGTFEVDIKVKGKDEASDRKLDKSTCTFFADG